ncbi:exodeoxyribonuclease VII small subunit [Peptostreptococcus stomatis]|mgnify:FL=1|uniref:Exodeoxyribonuclease 7 small subunit n=1 Tax=Peptostreptococcus stomatis DSM 17678 TaxID=596315 RepID=E0E166_9FIRM|nr:exodeoxyribonuclease VII small subunit [Peptostreptococcus stomatis]EFM65325.1 exodeoxyribonuclease VII, small subunit [Peptostreptococcus stomatis DSM 17678]
MNSDKLVSISEIDIEKMSYEEAFDMMKDLVSQLENGQVNLEESLKLFEYGSRLYRHCNAILEKTEMKISKFNEYKEEVEVD